MSPFSSDIVAVSLVLAATSSATARIRPSFLLDHVLWEATHIVLATEGEVVDGRLEVIESWRGDLVEGADLVLPDLAAFSGRDSRRMDRWPASGAPPRFVTGSRMLLFLKKAALRPQATKPEVSRWLPASYAGGFKTSVAWIEHGECYGLGQVENPGPSMITNVGTEVEFRARVGAFDAIRSFLDGALAEQNPSGVAQAIRTFHKMGFFRATEKAIEALGGMREHGLPMLRDLASEGAVRRWHWKIVHMMPRAGGPAVAADLTDIVREELGYWSWKAPGLKRGWWNNSNERGELREKHMRLHQALRELKKLRYPACRDVVTQIQYLWRSNSALRLGKNCEVLQACDGIIRQLDEG